MDTAETTYKDALSDAKIQSLIDDIHTLPTGNEYTAHVEERFRTEILDISGPDNEPDYLQFNELPDSAQQIIGYTEDGSLPWWLKSFNWGFEHSNGEHIIPENPEDSNGKHISTKNLEKLSDSNPERTEIKLPTLDESDIRTALDSLSDIGEFLSEQWEIEPNSDSDELTLPQNLFNLVQTGERDDAGTTVQVSEEYEDFFDDVVSLCPPINPVLQTINMVISGVDKKYYQLLPDPVQERVRELGIKSRTHYRLFNPISELYSIDTEFGVEIEVQNAQESLDPLEQLQYQAWAERQREGSHITDLIHEACEKQSSRKESDEDSIAKSLFVSPVYIVNRSGRLRPTLLTLKRGTYGRYKSKREKVLAIAEILDIDTKEIDDW